MMTFASVAVVVNPVEALIENSIAAMRSDPEVSKRDAEAALDLLKQHPNVDLEIRAHLQLCDYYSERAQASALQQITLINSLLPNAQRQGLRAGALECSGKIAETAGDTAQALALYDEAVSVATRMADTEMLAEGLFSRGYVHSLQDQYANGLADLQRAQALFEQLKMPQYALIALNGIANLYNRLGDFTQAKQIYQKTLVTQRKAGMLREQADTLYNLGRAEENLLQWDAARDNFSTALQISQQLNYSRTEAYALRGMATVANATGKPLVALETLEAAAALQRDTPDARLNAHIQLTRGIAYHQLQRLTESIAALEAAKRIFSAADSPNELNAVFTELALVYAQLGNWRKAYDARSAAQAISNGVLHNMLDQRFATLKIEFDIASKDKENFLLTRENIANQKALEQASTARKLQTAVITLSTILLVLLGILVWHQRRGKQHMRVLAMTDELTGVPNRRSVLTKLDALLQRDDVKQCSMLIIDIDHFKSINDKYGHPAGDETLKLVANCLRHIALSPAFSGRLGGEEFVLVLPERTLGNALLVAENVRATIAELDLSSLLGDRFITVSVGVTLSIVDDTPSTMLRRADAALYAAKHAGRNCVRIEPVQQDETKVVADQSAQVVMIAHAS